MTTCIMNTNSEFPHWAIAYIIYFLKSLQSQEQNNCKPFHAFLELDPNFFLLLRPQIINIVNVLTKTVWRMWQVQFVTDRPVGSMFKMHCSCYYTPWMDMWFPSGTLAILLKTICYFINLFSWLQKGNPALCSTSFLLFKSESLCLKYDDHSSGRERDSLS